MGVNGKTEYSFNMKNLAPLLHCFGNVVEEIKIKNKNHTESNGMAYGMGDYQSFFQAISYTKYQTKIKNQNDKRQKHLTNGLFLLPSHSYAPPRSTVGRNSGNRRRLT